MADLKNMTDQELIAWAREQAGKKEKSAQRGEARRAAAQRLKTAHQAEYDKFYAEECKKRGVKVD